MIKIYVYKLNTQIINNNSVLYYKTSKFKGNISFINIKVYIVTWYCKFFEYNMIVLSRIIECCPNHETDVHQLLPSVDDAVWIVNLFI
jgi:hypothetical protein